MNTPTVNRTILERGHLMPGRRFKQSLHRVSVVRLKSAGAPGSGKLFVHVACACQVKVQSPMPVSQPAQEKPLPSSGFRA